MSDPDASSGVRFTVFDYLGLAFLLGPPSVAAEVLMRGGEITSAGIHLRGCPIAIGVACVIIGRKWQKRLGFMHIHRFLTQSIDCPEAILPSFLVSPCYYLHCF